VESLADKKCIPCRGGVDPLAVSERKRLLENIHESWELKSLDNHLFRRYEFKDYKSSWNLLNKISELAEDQMHHPDISFGWGYLEITLYTHKIGSLVESDFILAAKIDRLKLA
jgi:4a-hydroxytetrahydrobiopterin dehydratase